MTEIRVPAEGRWSCQRCGKCCHDFVLGPVEPEIIAGLQALGVERDWAPAAASPWFVQRPSGAFLVKSPETGACVFLRDDMGCAIHGLYGAEAKPAFCRIFPFLLVRQAEALIAVARPACAELHSSYESGQPITEQVATLAELPRPTPLPTWQPVRVVVVPGMGAPRPEAVVLSRERWEELEAELRAGIHATVAPPAAHIARIRQAAFAAVERRGPPGNGPRMWLALSAMIRVMIMVLQAARQAEEEGRGSGHLRLVCWMEEQITRARQGLSSGGASRPGPPLDDGAQRYVGLLLRGELLSRNFRTQGSVAAGLGLSLLNVEVARRAAETNDEGQVTAAAFAAIHSRWVRLTRNGTLDPVLERARPALVDLFLHAPPE